jgi:chromosomal replication initiation ATPase DnaA
MPAVSGVRNVVPRQLALALGHATSLAREDFLEGPSNASALALIASWPDWPALNLLLVGPAGSGKTHLAAVWAAEAGARVMSAHMLAEVPLPTALATGALVIEDLAPGAFDERALFHLLNLARAERAHVLVTARSAPSGWQVDVPDLGSRLREVPVVTLTPPDDALLRAVLVKLFADRQVAVDESLIGYIATRIERSFAAARAIVAELDREALRQQRPVTRPLAGELLRDSVG